MIVLTLAGGWEQIGAEIIVFGGIAVAAILIRIIASAVQQPSNDVDTCDEELRKAEEGVATLADADQSTPVERERDMTPRGQTGDTRAEPREAWHSGTLAALAAATNKVKGEASAVGRDLKRVASDRAARRQAKAKTREATERLRLARVRAAAANAERERLAMLEHNRRVDREWDEAHPIARALIIVVAVLFCLVSMTSLFWGPLLFS